MVSEKPHRFAIDVERSSDRVIRLANVHMGGGTVCVCVCTVSTWQRMCVKHFLLRYKLQTFIELLINFEVNEKAIHAPIG